MPFPPLALAALAVSTAVLVYAAAAAAKQGRQARVAGIIWSGPGGAGAPLAFVLPPGQPGVPPVGGRVMGALQAFRPAGADPAGAALAAGLRAGGGGGGHPLALVRVPGAPGAPGAFLALEGAAAPRCAAGLPPHVASGAGRIMLWSPRKGRAAKNEGL